MFKYAALIRLQLGSGKESPPVGCVLLGWETQLWADEALHFLFSFLGGEKWEKRWQKKDMTALHFSSMCHSCRSWNIPLCVWLFCVPAICAAFEFPMHHELICWWTVFLPHHDNMEWTFPIAFYFFLANVMPGMHRIWTLLWCQYVDNSHWH